MKNIIKYLFITVFSLGLASCSNDVEVPDHGPVGNPETAIVGTYTGTWTRSLTGTTPTVESGTITFTTVEGRNYVTNVHVECPALELDMESIANIINYSGGYMFYNQDSSNGFQNTFTGRVVDGNATINFSKTDKYKNEKGKWVTSTFTYSFTGDK